MWGWVGMGSGVCACASGDREHRDVCVHEVM